MLGIHYSAQESLSVADEKRGQQEQTLANPESELLQKGGSASSLSPTPTATPAGLCFRWLLAPQKSPGVWGSTGQTVLEQGTVMCTSVKPSGGEACSSAEMTFSTSWNIFHFHVIRSYNELTGKTQSWLTPWAAPVTLTTEPLEMDSPLELHFEESRVCSNSTPLSLSTTVTKPYTCWLNCSHLNLASVAPVTDKTEWHKQIL